MPVHQGNGVVRIGFPVSNDVHDRLDSQYTVSRWVLPPVQLTTRLAPEIPMTEISKYTWIWM